MNTPIILPEENKKRAAYKRFSKIGIAGIAVISVSAFTNLSAQQLVSAQEKDTVLKPKSAFVNMLNDSLQHLENGILNHPEAHPPVKYGNYTNYADYSNHCDYLNYANYSNGINNNYVDNYSNNYSNYGDYSNYSNYSNYLNIK